MKPLTSNIIYLAITGVLIIGVGSLTYTISSKKENANLNKNQISTSTQKATSNKEDLDDNYEDADDFNTGTITQTPPATKPTNTSKSYTTGDVATHNNQSSCWTMVNGNVYDVTSYINSHPGGQSAVESICGIDGSGAFNNQHGGASKPEKVLQSFLIGPLK